MQRLTRIACVLAALAGPIARGQSDGPRQFGETPLAVSAEVAFPHLKIHRPVLVTHAGDRSGRLFVVSQLGKIHVFTPQPGVERTRVFLDISSRVAYKDSEFELGLVGLAFHPQYQQNGQFFICYTPADDRLTTIVSRFRVSKFSADRADAKSEEELFRVQRPFWNHVGGTLAFGPDGMLYIALGDGGAANDPYGNGQNTGVLLGKILRIDVDRGEQGKTYAIPKDNPFADGGGGARPEIWAYGIRNVWRFSFDRASGQMWAGDVGQDLWEEIDLLRKGGNYGWRLREGWHEFKDSGVGPRDDLIEPIWEYSHEIGKSIIGGHVYRGQRVRELVGKYLYADYVSGKLWALDYDQKNQKVVANYRLRGDNLPVMSFGEDEAGEAYFSTEFGRIYRFRSGE